MKVAVLILNYNCPDKLLRTCLASIYNQTYKNFKVFLIDNHSNQPPDWTTTKFPKISLVKHLNNLGVGPGFNPIIKKVVKSFDAIFFVSPDARLDPHCLKYLVTTLTANPKTSIINSLTYNQNKSQIDNCGGTINNLFLGVMSGYLPKPIPSKPFPVLYGIATAMLVKSSAFKTFGLFNESFFIYFEEIDFSFRLKLAGQTILTNPQAIAFHQGHASHTTSKLANKVRGCAETNLLATYYHTFSVSTLILLLPLLIINRSLLSLIYLTSSPSITLAKLKGIAIFLIRFLTGFYQPYRHQAQAKRTISDYKLLSQNPTPLFSLTPLIKTLKPWLTTIKKNL